MLTLHLLLLFLSTYVLMGHASLLSDHWQSTSSSRLAISATCYHDTAELDPADLRDTFAIPAPPLTSRPCPASNFSVARQSAVLRDAGETTLTTGQFVSGRLEAYGSTAYFSYKPISLNVPIDIFLSVGICAETFCGIYVLMNGSPYATYYNATYKYFYNTAIRIDSAHPLSCEYRNIPLTSCEYYYTLFSYSNSQLYFTVVMTPPRGLAELISGNTQTGTLEAGASAFYYVINGGVEEVMIFALEITAGECDLYVSTTTERPGIDNYTWSSVDDGDDLVIVNGTNAGLGGHPGLYYYVGVHNTRMNSSSGYSLIGSGYSTTGRPLDNAWRLAADIPQKDYAMANTYRYYNFYVDGVWPQLTITLDSLRGDVDMSALTTLQRAHAPQMLYCLYSLSFSLQPISANCVRVISYANIAAYVYSSTGERDVWPSTASSQYNSTTNGLDQLNVTLPTSGYYVWIAVYSKGTDSRYSIVITGDGRITTLYIYGYPITAQVSARRSLYYVATVPSSSPVTEYMFTFTLRSLSGNADLYISDTYMFPNATHHNWTSEVAGDGLDMAVLRGDGIRPQLHAGNYYVAVRGNTESSFQLWSYLRERQYLQVNSVVSQSTYGGVLYWEIQVPRDAEFSITTTPGAFYGGSFNLYVGNVAEPIPSVASTYQIKSIGAVRVTLATSPCIGNGPSCHYFVAAERVHADNETAYASFTILVLSPNVPLVQLLPDVPLEKPVGTRGSTTYQFNVTCPRSKVALTLVTYEEQMRGITAPMSVNRGPLPPLSVLANSMFEYPETEAQGLRTNTLSFDWTHPLLRGQKMQGVYMVTVVTTYITGWTILLRVDGGSCAALPPWISMYPLMPYAATTNATSLAYFSYQTARGASGDLFFTLSPRNASASLPAASILARTDGDVPAAGYAQFSSGSMNVLRVPADACSNGASIPINSSMCQYTLAVSSTTDTTVAYYLTASSSQPLYTLDVSTPAAKLAGSVARSAAVLGTAIVPRGTAAISLVTEACIGSVTVYLNYHTEAVPTVVSADASSVAITSPTALAAMLNTVNDTHLVTSVVGVGAAINRFETRLLTGYSWSAASPTATTATLAVTDYRSVNSGYARVRVPLAAVPAAVTAGTIRQPTGTAGYLRYSVYLNDTTSQHNLRSRCGLSGGAVLAHTAVGLTSISNTLDVKLPASSRRYTLTVLVDHVWRTTVGSRNYSYEASSPGYLVYTPVDVRGGTKAPEDESSSSSGMMPPLPVPKSSGLATSTIVVVSIVLFLAVVALMAACVWNHRRRTAGGSGMQLLSSDDSTRLSLPSDIHVQPHSQYQQQPAQLAGEAFYAMSGDSR